MSTVSFSSQFRGCLMFRILEAASTCVSDFTDVCISYSTVIFMYLKPSWSHKMGIYWIMFVFICMLKLQTYNLRNKAKITFVKIIMKEEYYFLLSYLCGTHRIRIILIELFNALLAFFCSWGYPVLCSSGFFFFLGKENIMLKM